MILTKKDYIGYQGVPGAYSEEALITFFGENNKTIRYDNFEDVIKSVLSEEIKYGILPIENSSTGAITSVYDLHKIYDVYIVGEQMIKINHNLLGTKNSSISDVAEIYSHPQGFEQSSKFLKSHPDWKQIAYFNTAMSASLVNDNQNKSFAAIASKRAAKIFNLEILAENINNDSTNTTRFIIIGKHLEKDDEFNKISLLLRISNEVGSLYGVIKRLASQNINMLKIESRPIEGIPWEYDFFIDIDGNLKDEQLCHSLSNLEKSAHQIKILGNYKKGQSL